MEDDINLFSVMLLKIWKQKGFIYEKRQTTTKPVTFGRWYKSLFYNEFAHLKKKNVLSEKWKKQNIRKKPLKIEIW